MRFNDRELVQISERKPIIEGLLQYLRPQSNDWSDWYQQPAFKERFFKLVNNLLFYFRVNSMDEPLGIIVLEQMQVAYETPGPAFAFSLSFNDGKHVFACRCQEDLTRWVSALQTASYQYWRSMHTILQTKISMRLGIDPILINVRKKEEAAAAASEKRVSNSTFYGKEGTYPLRSIPNAAPNTKQKHSNVPVDNLIDLSG